MTEGANYSLAGYGWRYILKIFLTMQRQMQTSVAVAWPMHFARAQLLMSKISNMYSIICLPSFPFFFVFVKILLADKIPLMSSP